MPDELIIVDMGGPSLRPPICPFPIKIISLKDQNLPLAKARNRAASQARSETLLFLDVDCIPMAGLLGTMKNTLDIHNALICAEVRYLQKNATDGDWTEDSLLRQSACHPARSFPPAGVQAQTNPGLFWSLAFGIKRTLFNSLGGFDERFFGYGAEDTDFGFRAKQAGVDLLFLGGASAFHQYHDIVDPPLQHFDDILRNAKIFHDIWNVWPMQGWLEAFEQLGLIRLGNDRIIDLKASLVPKI